MSIISELNELSDAWKAQFDNPPSILFPWEIDTGGFLRLQGVRICPSYEFAKADAFDAEWLRLDIQNGDYVIVEIDWPYNGEPRISEVVTHKVFPSIDGEGS